MILLSSIVILSYLFNTVSRITRVPAVLLLLVTGICIKYLSRYYGYVDKDVAGLVKLLGAIGLIMIILEAALDLEIHRGKLRLIRNSFFSAAIVFVVSAAGIGYLLSYWLAEPLSVSLLYAIPMSIISSAIVIPSIDHLPALKKEFIIYESSFSDILGILLFNYMLMGNVFSMHAIAAFTANVFLAMAISAIASLLLLYMLTKIKVGLKFFLIFAILALVYGVGELINIPSLLIVLVFGLVINNSSLFLRGRFKRLASPRHMHSITHLMRSITAETSFLIRTFFFILFGYSIHLQMLMQAEVIELGSFIVAILLVVRFIYLRLILRSNLLPELFLMPRGLITILLFYSIPPSRSSNSCNIGVLFFVVVVTSIIMMAGLMFFRPKEAGEILESEEQSAAN